MEKWNTILLYFGSFAWFAHTFSNVVFKIQGAQIRSDRKVVGKCTAADAPKACQPNRLMRFMDSTSVCLCSFRHKPQYETPSRTHSVPTGWIYIFFVLHITPCFFISLTIPILQRICLKKNKEKPVRLLYRIRSTACFLSKAPSCHLRWRHHNQYRSLGR